MSTFLKTTRVCLCACVGYGKEENRMLLMKRKDRETEEQGEWEKQNVTYFFILCYPTIRIADKSHVAEAIVTTKIWQEKYLHVRVERRSIIETISSHDDIYGKKYNII